MSCQRVRAIPRDSAVKLRPAGQHGPTGRPVRPRVRGQACVYLAYVCMLLHAYVCNYMCKHACTYVHMYVCISVCLYVCRYARICTCCTYVCICIRMHAFIYVCTYVRMYMFFDACVYQRMNALIYVFVCMSLKRMCVVMFVCRSIRM